MLTATTFFFGRPSAVTWGFPHTTFMFALICVLGFGPRAQPQPPEVTHEAVDQAIRRGVEWVWAQRKSAGHWQARDDAGSRGDMHWAGDSALAVLALLYANEDARETRLSQSLDWLAGEQITGTYVYGVRAHVLAIVPGGRFKSELERDLQWLLNANWSADSEHPGAYDYKAIPRESHIGRWDNSVTQYGVLGVWMAAEAGQRVPDTYWDAIGKHWLTYQNGDGGWGYQKGHESTGSMTAAGLASLFVVLDQRYLGRTKDAGGVLNAIDAGLNWFGREYTPENPHGDEYWKYYYLYGVERVGRASGYKHFREVDWFREGAAYLLRVQQDSGAWPNTGGGASDLRNTAFALMFLCHGRAPLLFNKLQHGPDWNDKLRDVAGLTRYTGRTFERMLNWQIVNLDGPLEDLLEAPVLYMRGASSWEFSDAEVEKLRAYCQRGGLLFAVAGNDSAEFRRCWEQLARRAFPDLSPRVAASDHPLFSGEIAGRIEQPPLTLEVHNGVRTLMLLCTHDVADAWSRYGARSRGSADFDVGAAVYLYATDKTTFTSRLEAADIVDRGVPVERTVELVRIKYNGPWDVEPYGWTRLRRYLRNETGTNLLVTAGVTFDAEGLGQFRVAHITGTDAFELSPAEVRGLRAFLLGGGTLLADAAAGSPAFTRSLEGYVQEALREPPRVVAPESFLITGEGLAGAADLRGTSYRRAARRASGGREIPLLRTVSVGRRYAVISTPLDVSIGLLGTPAYNVEGYAPESALRIMRNLLLYAGLPSAEKAALQREGTAP